jgi:23S rRNA (cytosine1962-C5)-methyltransferase
MQGDRPPRPSGPSAGPDRPPFRSPAPRDFRGPRGNDTRADDPPVAFRPRFIGPRPEPPPSRSRDAALQGSENWAKPWVQMRTFSYHPAIFPAMIGAVSPGAQPGDWVTVHDKNGRPFGHGLWNPSARVPLRVLHHGETATPESYLFTLIDLAIDLRLRVLDLPSRTNAFRVIHSDADCLSGLVVDRFGDVLSVQVHSLGIWKRLPGILKHLHAKLGTLRTVIEVDPPVARHENIRVADHPSDAVRTVRIQEHGIRYEVDFAAGHKTGFFCDQRENRRRLAAWTKDKRVLDLCCYTGGFSLSAKVTGGAAEVTGVDLDENVVALARRNANLNQARIEWVHCDAYAYARQMRKDGKKFDVVILDPPKLIDGREEIDHEEGLVKYEDLNSLGIVITEPGGLLVTCSCSGQLSAEDFERLVIRAAHRVGRKLQFVDRTGAGEDHPVMSNCPESRYLKLLWARVF